MKKNSKRIAQRLLVLFFATLLLAGCARTPAVSYYQLTATRVDGTAPAPSPANSPVIGIGPVRIAEHLDRPQLILHTSANRLQLSESHRWAEPLAANITWVLRDNLSGLLGTEHFLLYPWERTTAVDYQVSIEVLRCEGLEDGTAQLAALWSITGRTGQVLLPPKRSNYQFMPATPGQEGLAGALSEALALLSQDIGRELSLLPAPMPGN